jgi:hypothetical protein
VDGLVLEPSDQRLEFSEFSLYSCRGFLDTPVRCWVKCARGCELLVDLILVTIISHVTLLALIGVFATLRFPNPVLRISSLPIIMCLGRVRREACWVCFWT